MHTRYKIQDTRYKIFIVHKTPTVGPGTGVMAYNDMMMKTEWSIVNVLQQVTVYNTGIYIYIYIEAGQTVI